jgi:putative peptidoglycan lipid II flippase
VGLRQRGVYNPAPGWAAFGLKVVLASAAMGALLWWANQGFDWTALRARPGQRVALLSAVLAGAALLYFGLLAAMGLHPRQFMRRA